MTDHHTPHGERRSYARGCRCGPCVRSNASYTQCRRKGAFFPDPAELVEASASATHLRELQKLGVGYRQAAALSGIDPTTVRNVRSGKTLLIRADTSVRLLAVKPVLAHGQRVTGWRSWRLLDSLQREGYSNAAIARFLGMRSDKLQLEHRHMRVKSALRVRRLWTVLMSEEGASLTVGGEVPSRAPATWKPQAARV